jgi:hypothetical protein
MPDGKEGNRESTASPRHAPSPRLRPDRDVVLAGHSPAAKPL